MLLIRRWYSLFLIGGVFFLAGCDPENSVLIEEEPEIIGYEGVDEALWIYFERFEEEAAQRGLIIDLRASGITGMIEDIDGENIAGQCNFSSRFPNHVTVDSEFFNNTSDFGREFVVFHELGHCELLRGHREDAFSNGTCESLMRSGLGDCRDNYRFGTRTSYLDELFDQQFFNDIQ